MVYIKNKDLKLKDIPTDLKDKKKVSSFIDSIVPEGVNLTEFLYKDCTKSLDKSFENSSLTELRKQMYFYWYNARWYPIDKVRERTVEYFLKIREKVKSKEFT